MQFNWLVFNWTLSMYEGVSITPILAWQRGEREVIFWSKLRDFIYEWPLIPCESRLKCATPENGVTEQHLKMGVTEHGNLKIVVDGDGPNAVPLSVVLDRVDSTDFHLV